MRNARTAVEGLRGRRVLITRPREQAARMAETYSSLGAEAIVAPAIAIAAPTSWDPLDGALVRLDSYAWLVVTSAHAASAVRERLQVLGVAPRLTTVRWAAVGPATAAALPEAVHAGVLVSPEHMAESLAETIPDVNGRRILFPRGDRAREVLAERLRSRGASVDDPVAYRTMPGEGLAVIVSEIASDRCDAIVFTSPSAVGFVDSALSRGRVSLAARARQARPAVFCLGPVTAEAARDRGVEPHGVGAASAEDLVRVMSDWFAHVVAS